MAIAFYAAMWLGSNIRPLTLSELVTWVSGLSGETQTAIATSLLTILGFLVAFHTATLNWKQHAQAHLKATVAGEIEQFFAESGRLLIDASLYAKLLVETVENIQRDGSTARTEFDARYALSQTPAFFTTRQRLSAMSVEVHRLLGKNSVVLSTTWGAIRTLEEAITAFTEPTQLMWFRTPYIDKDDPDLLGIFVTQVHVGECTAFIDAVRTNQIDMSGMAGSVTGRLLAPIVGSNFSLLATLLGNRAKFRHAIDLMSRQRKRDN